MSKNLYRIIPIVMILINYKERRKRTEVENAERNMENSI